VGATANLLAVSPVVTPLRLKIWKGFPDNGPKVIAEEALLDEQAVAPRVLFPIQGTQYVLAI
jgi:hypothetical protein